MSDRQAADDLLLKVARCRVMGDVLERNERSPCCDVVLSQWDPAVGPDERASRHRDEQWTPEPWNGPLTTAGLLVISINPAGRERLINSTPARPTPAAAAGIGADHPSLARGNSFARQSWDAGEIADFFNARWALRFGADGAARDVETAARGKSQRFLARVARWVAEITGGPGLDENVCLTELVRCGSKTDGPARRAVKTCTNLYLEDTLRFSPARVVLLVGAKPRQHFGLALWDLHERTLGGMNRLCVAIPHPNARGPRPSLEHGLGAEALERLRQAFRHHS